MSLKFHDLEKDIARCDERLGSVTDLMLEGDEEAAWKLLQRICEAAKDQAWRERNGLSESEGLTGEVHPMFSRILKAHGVG